MPKQMATRRKSLSREDFFDDERDYDYGYQPYVQGSLAVEVEIPEPYPSEEELEAEQKRIRREEARKRQLQQLRKAEEMARIKSKFNFFLCAGLVLAGCLAVVLMYMKVFSQEAAVSELEAELQAAKEANAIAQETVINQMTINELYSYAIGTLGMVEADSGTTMQIEVKNQSYTTSSLPTENANTNKVTFHWFG